MSGSATELSAGLMPEECSRNRRRPREGDGVATARGEPRRVRWRGRVRIGKLATIKLESWKTRDGWMHAILDVQGASNKASRTEALEKGTLQATEASCLTKNHGRELFIITNENKFDMKKLRRWEEIMAAVNASIRSSSPLSAAICSSGTPRVLSRVV